MRVSESFATAVALYIVLTAPAMAYIDPGTGSMLLQALAALVISCSLAVRMYWHAVRSFLLRLFKANKREGHN